MWVGRRAPVSCGLRCDECRAPIAAVAEVPEEGAPRADQLALCADCLRFALLRSTAWLYLNPEHHAVARRLQLPLRGLLQPTPPELDSIHTNPN
jgi:hypothetical protein